MNQAIDDVLLAHAMAQVFPHIDKQQWLSAYQDLLNSVKSGDSLCSYVPSETYENLALPELLRVVESIASSMRGVVIEVIDLRVGKPQIPAVTAGPVCHVLEISMPETVGDYDCAYDVPEWDWVREHASFSHKGNHHHDNPTYEFLFNMANYDALDEGVIPERLWPVFRDASKIGAGYVLFHNE